MVSVKDIRVAGTGDCGVRRMLPTRAGDKPPRYIDSGGGQAPALFPHPSEFRLSPE